MPTDGRRPALAYGHCGGLDVDAVDRPTPRDPGRSTAALVAALVVERFGRLADLTRERFPDRRVSRWPSRRR